MATVRRSPSSGTSFRVLTRSTRPRPLCPRIHAPAWPRSVDLMSMQILVHGCRGCQILRRERPPERRSPRAFIQRGYGSDSYAGRSFRVIRVDAELLLLELRARQE